MRMSLTMLDTYCRTALLISLGALAWAGRPLLAQQIYKSVDAQGNVIYSDKAPAKNAPKVDLRVKEPDPAEVARLEKQQAQLKAADLQRSLQHAIDEKNKAVDDHKREAACQSARNRFYQLKDSGRIFKRDAEGNRVYYSDSDAEAMREQARRAMVAACGS